MEKSTARVAVVQYELKKIATFEEFAAQCSLFVRNAAIQKADFVLFPELFTTQLLSFLAADNTTIGAELTAFTDRFIELFSALAREAETHIIAGSHLTLEEGRLHNISYFFDRKGSVSKQYKLHITPHEREAWGVESGDVPGDAVRVFDTDKGKIAILICYDIEFPELSRIATSKGARIIFCPSNTDQKSGYLRVRYCSQARAVENQVYVAVTGCLGTMPMLGSEQTHYSQAAIFTPSDTSFPEDAVAAECPANVEMMITQDLDLDALELNRKEGSVRTWSDRRADLYRVCFTDLTGPQLV
jgi:predicted amidohydrolase